MILFRTTTPIPRDELFMIYTNKYAYNNFFSNPRFATKKNQTKEQQKSLCMNNLQFLNDVGGIMGGLAVSGGKGGGRRSRAG